MPIDDNNLYNPYGHVTCLVLYLYSMELGIPPLYAEINRISRKTYKQSTVLTLGPFVKAFCEVIKCAQRYKDPMDRLPTGAELGGTYDNLAGITVMYSGGILH